MHTYNYHISVKWQFNCLKSKSFPLFYILYKKSYLVTYKLKINKYKEFLYKKKKTKKNGNNVKKWKISGKKYFEYYLKMYLNEIMK